MKFDNLGLDAGSRVSQYIRLHHMNSAESVVRFMKEGWQLPTPDLIISVTGGAKNFDMSARLRKIFQRGLVAAAVTTSKKKSINSFLMKSHRLNLDAWLITAGTNTGVVKEVGEALSNYRYKNRKHGSDVVCMGIGSWGYTAGNDQLIVQPSGGKTKGMSKNDSRISQKGTSNQSATYLVRQRFAFGFAFEYRFDLGHDDGISCTKLYCEKSPTQTMRFRTESQSFFIISRWTKQCR